MHRICFALSLFHFILGATLIGVKDTKDKRAAIQNGWWGPKVLAWIVLIVIGTFVGPIAWLIAGKERKLPGRRPRPRGPLGPDDDPDFLRGI